MTIYILKIAGGKHVFFYIFEEGYLAFSSPYSFNGYIFTFIHVEHLRISWYKDPLFSVCFLSFYYRGLATFVLLPYQKQLLFSILFSKSLLYLIFQTNLRWAAPALTTKRWFLSICCLTLLLLKKSSFLLGFMWRGFGAQFRQQQLQPKRNHVKDGTLDVAKEVSVEKNSILGE